MAKPDHQFREFVAGFADPLSRLAFLLTAGSHLDASDLTNSALAQVRREWREAEETGTPEAQAVEELVIALPRHGKERAAHAAAVPDDARTLQTPGSRPAVPVVPAPPRSPFVPPVAPPSAPPVGSGFEAPPEPETDAELLRGAVWTAWTTLPPRLRVPLVFADASVASRRLAGLDVPESFGSSHRVEATAADAMRLLRARVLSDLPQVGVDSVADARLTDVLDSTLREHAIAAPGPIDPYPLVLARLRSLRLRATATVAVVVAVLAVAVGVAVRVSKPDKATSTSAAAAASRSGFLPVPQAVPSVATGSGPAAQGPFAPVARPGGPVLVVPWVTRGTAAKDPTLIANLESYFATVHTDAVGQTQVLLATDTSAFRIAYVTANSPNGVIQSWFYGPVGSENLIEGATSYGGSLLPTSVLTDGLIDPSGHEEFIVIAPPDTTGMQIANFDFTSRHTTPGFAPLPYQNGIAVRDVTPPDSASSFVVDVTVGTASYTLKDAPDIQLIPRFSGSTTSNGPPSSSPLPTPSVERGKPDPTLVTEALQVAAAWETTSVPPGTGHPVVVWGGTDATGTRLVVLRVKTGVVDLMVLEWSGDAPGLHGEILIHATAPEVPIAFSYRALDGVRIGVVGSPDAKRATLTYNGKLSKSVALDSTGFASFPITNPSPPPSNDATSDLD
ncbi:MAG TPA: hypothetical protein VK662_09260, partial [Acidothermaceae bacterium]|nr:hypothetical protein [Acidothermaceae bacterium]